MCRLLISPLRTSGFNMLHSLCSPTVASVNNGSSCEGVYGEAFGAVAK